MVATRLLQIFATLWLATSAVFVLIHLSGDPTQGFLPPGSSPELRAAISADLGLNDPLWQQYIRFVGRGFLGDFGDSWRDNRPALEAVLARTPGTLQLATVAMALAVVFGMGYALLTRRHGRIRAVLDVFPSIGQAIPTFWLGAVMMLIFAVKLRWLPSSGNASAGAIVLPALTLALQPASTIARILITSMDDVSRADYVRTARSKGLSSGAIIARHMAPNALLPAIGFIGLQAGFMIGGSVVVESLFAWPGIGRLALQSALQRDLPVIHAFVAVTAIGVIAINMLMDGVRLAIDPRLRNRPAVGGTRV